MRRSSVSHRADPQSEVRGAIVPSLRQKLEAILASGGGDLRRPVLGKGNESSVKGLFIIGDLAGAPVIKLAMAQGVEVVDYIASLPDMRDRATPAREGHTSTSSGLLEIKRPYREGD